MGKSKEKDVDLIKIKKDLQQMILGLCAMWSAIFSTLSAITISVIVGIRHQDIIVEVIESSVNLLAIVLKLYSIFV